MIQRNLVIYVLCSFAAIAFSSCMKKPDHTPDFGPEVSLTEIQKASNVDMPTQPETIKEGQSISLDWYQVIDTQRPDTFYQRADLVTRSVDKTLTGGDYKFCWSFSVHAMQKDYQTGQWKESIDKYGPLAYPSSQDTDCSDVQSQVKNLNSASVNTQDLREFSLQGLESKDAEKKVKVTYHKLKREDTTMPVPQVVAAKPNWCSHKADTNGVIAPCRNDLRVVRLSFDRVEWPDGEKPFKVSYSFTFSSDVPTYINDWLPGSIALSNQVESCAQFWQEFTSGETTQNVPIRRCVELVDFQFGK